MAFARKRAPQRRRHARFDLMRRAEKGLGLIIGLCLLTAVGLAVFQLSPGTLSFGLGKSKARKGTPHVCLVPDPTTSSANITTKGLYDSIGFKNEEGGVWRQGWEVKYQGNEWDNEPLQVFVVPHSHNDPGWLLTVEDYYQQRSRHILDTIVATLLEDKDRRFIWEEMSYLHRWWQDADDGKKTSVINLVKSGQLEIVGGGWVMNDEANSHYFAILEQYTEGNLWLQDTVGATPTSAWAIDPFGHSPTMAYLLRRMGFRDMLIQRTHYEVKKVLAQEQALEFRWRQDWDEGGAGAGAGGTDMFCHMMPFYSYDIPHTCGPDPSICCQFDFARHSGSGASYWCPWGISPQLIDDSNVAERAKKLLDQYRKKSMLYKTNVVLAPLGDDFRYTTMQEARYQFENYERIFKYINSHPELSARISWGTLADYFGAVRKWDERRLAQSHLKPLEQFPVLSGDFFTYADREQDYWSGYYTSRPFFKSVDRVLEQTLRAAEILFTLSHAAAGGAGAAAGGGASEGEAAFPFNHAERLVAARRNLALFQHHDGVTGTAKDPVMVDYGTRMWTALKDLQSFMTVAVPFLLHPRGSPPSPSAAASAGYTPAETRDRHNALPQPTPFPLPRAAARRVVLFNPLAAAADRVVSVSVVTEAVCVLLPGGGGGGSHLAVPSQLAPDWRPRGRGAAGPAYRLWWRASVPGLGLRAYIVASPADVRCKPAVRATVEAYNVPGGWACPGQFRCTQHGTSGGDGTIRLGLGGASLTLSLSDGLARELRGAGGAGSLTLHEDFRTYTSQRSGAYLFLPQGPSASLVARGGLVLVTRGPLVEEAYTEPARGEGGGGGGHVPVVRWARVFGGEGAQAAAVEMQHHVDIAEMGNQELVVRYQTGVNNTGETGQPVYYSDLNGFQTIRRETYAKIPTQGNFYPMPAWAFLQSNSDPASRFSVHTRQAVGVAALEMGSIEMMLERRLLQDDGRGLEQGVTDTHPNDITFHLLLEKSSQVGRAKASLQGPRSLTPSLLSHAVGLALGHPWHVFIGPPSSPAAQKALSEESLLAPLQRCLPCDLHVVNLKVARPLRGQKGHIGADGPEPLVAMLVQRHGFDCTFGTDNDGESCRVSDGGWDLGTMFQDLVVKGVRRTSLNLLHDVDAVADGLAATLKNPLGRKGGGKESSLWIDVREMEIAAVKMNLMRT